MGTMDRNSTEVQEQTSDEKRTIANMASSTGDLEKNDNKTRAPSTVNAFQVSSQIGFSQWQPETVLSLNEFRGLMGIPLDETIDEDHGNPAKRGPIYALPAKINRPHTIPVWLRRIFIREDPESPTSIYYALIHEERRTRHKLRWYEVKRHSYCNAWPFTDVLNLLGNHLWWSPHAAYPGGSSDHSWGEKNDRWYRSCNSWCSSRSDSRHTFYPQGTRSSSPICALLRCASAGAW